MEIKEDKQGSICKDCNSKEIVWSMPFKKEVCRDCGSDKIVPIIKKWVAVDNLEILLKSCLRRRRMKDIKQNIQSILNSLSNENKKEKGLCYDNPTEPDMCAYCGEKIINKYHDHSKEINKINSQNSKTKKEQK